MFHLYDMEIYSTLSEQKNKINKQNIYKDVISVLHTMEVTCLSQCMKTKIVILNGTDWYVTFTRCDFQCVLQLLCLICLQK